MPYGRRRCRNYARSLVSAAASSRSTRFSTLPNVSFITTGNSVPQQPSRRRARKCPSAASTHADGAVSGIGCGAFHRDQIVVEHRPRVHLGETRARGAFHRAHTVLHPTDRLPHQVQLGRLLDPPGLQQQPRLRRPGPNLMRVTGRWTRSRPAPRRAPHRRRRAARTQRRSPRRTGQLPRRTRARSWPCCPARDEPRRLSPPHPPSAHNRRTRSGSRELLQQQQEPLRPYHPEHGHVPHTTPVDDVDRICRQDRLHPGGAHHSPQPPLPNGEQVLFHIVEHFNSLPGTRRGPWRGLPAAHRRRRRVRDYGLRCSPRAAK